MNTASVHDVTSIKIADPFAEHEPPTLQWLMVEIFDIPIMEPATLSDDCVASVPHTQQLPPIFSLRLIDMFEPTNTVSTALVRDPPAAMFPVMEKVDPNETLSKIVNSPDPLIFLYTLSLPFTEVGPCATDRPVPTQRDSHTEVDIPKCTCDLIETIDPKYPSLIVENAFPLNDFPAIEQELPNNPDPDIEHLSPLICITPPTLVF